MSGVAPPSDTTPTQALILSGGLGTRLGAAATVTPKHLMPVAGEPFAHHQLRWLAANGITEIVECVGHLGDAIEDALGDGSPFGVSIRYVHDGPELLGTGGAIAAARAELHDAFVVVYGDSFLRLDLDEVRAAWRDTPAQTDSLMCVFRNEGRFDTPNVYRDSAGRFTYDKRADDVTRATMQYIDYGLSVLTTAFVDGRLPPTGAYDLADALCAASLAGTMVGLEVRDRFYEIGTPATLAELDAYLRSTGSAT